MPKRPRSTVERVLRTHADIAATAKYLDDLNKIASKLEVQIQGTRYDSTLVESLRVDLAKCQTAKRRAERVLDELSQKKTKLAGLQFHDVERKTIRRQKHLETEREVTKEVRAQADMLRKLSQEAITFGRPLEKSQYAFDIFISHASEDKDDFVRPLAGELVNLNLRVWYDEFSLSLGDSLRRSIDHGLTRSKFGLVVLSSAFFSKNWTQYELNGLVSREMEGAKVILPIWHKVTKDDVLHYSPTLVDKVAISSAQTEIREIARKVAHAIRRSDA